MQRNPENRKLATTKMLSHVWQSWLLLLWAMWWGGLSFYALFVVPIATEQIGSASQGFITQQVTLWHNGLTGAFLLCLGIESIRRHTYFLWSVTLGLGLIEAALIYWHRHLTLAMDFEEQSVPSGFYGEHAIYLWLTAAEWLIGLCLAFWWCSTQPSSDKSV